jgi:uncharacterized protein YndB with AHSA1/START domain
MPKTRDLRFSLTIKAKPEQVYRALTSATELCRWWLQGAETDARNVGRFRMVWPKVADVGGRSFPRHVAVGESEGYFVDLEPGRKVAWMWRLPRKGQHIPAFSSFFIRALPRGCEVTLVHSGFSSRPRTDKYFLGCAEGWEDCLAKLKLYLEAGRTCKNRVLTFTDLKALLKKPR